MSSPELKLLKRFAAKYIWWRTPDEAATQPERVVFQVMDLGDYDDVQELAKAVGDEYLKNIMGHARTLNP